MYLGNLPVSAQLAEYFLGKDEGITTTSPYMQDATTTRA